ncbi:MAG: hypothetical protein ACP5KN_02480 [Armatimonadota bacterium]
MSQKSAVALTLAVCACVGAQDAQNVLTNGDFSAVADDGTPVGWAYWVKGGQPAFRIVDAPDGSYVEVTIPDRESNSRMSQGLDLPDAHYYRATCECRVLAADEVPPSFAMRIAFMTPRGLWRVWEYTDGALEGRWQTLTREFVVPNEAEPGDIKFHFGTNGEPGQIQIRNVRLVEIPLTDYQRENVHVTDEGHRYFPKHTAPPPEPDLPEEIREAGLFWWQPADRDGATPWDVPDTAFDQLNPALNLAAAAGSSARLIFVIEATRDIADVGVVLPQMMAPPEIGPWGRLEASLVRVWRQRDGHRGGFYHEVPELLEPIPTGIVRGLRDLKAGERLQVMLRFQAAPGARPRETRVDLRAVGTDPGQGRQETHIPLTVTVLPFELAPAPDEVVWGLYPDPGRWQSYTDEQLMAELQWLRECGINSMLLYVLGVLELPEALTDENVEQALADWRAALAEWGDRYMVALMDAGFGPRLVANVQSLDTMLARAMGVEPVSDGVYNPKLLEYERRFVQVLEDLRAERGWPELTWHMIDEPGGGRNVAATAEFELIDQMGLRGFTTANQPAVIRDFADILDDFCAGAGVLNSPEKARRAHEWLAHRDDATLWQYGGAGTYTGQEGSMGVNRWGTGFLTWRNGASGEFFWTFQRTSGDPYDDFDGTKRGKDFCLTYPAPEGGRSVSTLQWEGICEGIIDYRHLVMLEAEIEAARQRGAAEADTAGRIAGELDGLRESLWSLAEPPSNRMLDDWRAQVAAWIMELRQNR